RLIIPDHALGFPVLRALSLCTCCRHYPGAADGRSPRSKFTHPCQPSPIPLSGRPAHRPFRGLLSVHSRCGLPTRTGTICRDRYPKASDTSSPPCLLRLLPAGAIAGRGLHPLEKRRLVTAHVDSGHYVNLSVEGAYLCSALKLARLRKLESLIAVGRDLVALLAVTA